jgi:hypothetical protein
MFGRFERDGAPSESQNGPSDPPDDGMIGLASRIFRIGYAGRGGGAPRM